jgi:enamine deaminase RidA (YjgF/YER057c/UK114 family)
MGLFRLAAIGVVLALIFGTALDAKRKKKGQEEEEETQVLPALKDPPPAVVAETDRLVFRTSPLSAKGLLSPQVREALKELIRDNHGATIVKLRAFVAGTGDVRRVQTLVSETFTEKHLNLPALSVVQAGGLPMEGAQVVIESIAVDKKTMNPHGLAFISGQPATSVAKSVEQVQAALTGIGLSGSRVLRATCFVSAIESASDAGPALASAFPNAAHNLVQMERVPVEPAAECEAVAALERPVGAPVRFESSNGNSHSQMALVSAPKLVLTGTQLAFQEQEPDVKLALDRLGRTLESQGATYKDTVMSHVYVLSRPATDAFRKLRFQFLDQNKPPAGTLLPFEGLPSADASLGIDVVAALNR